MRRVSWRASASPAGLKGPAAIGAISSGKREGIMTTQKLRDLLHQDDLLVVPGAYDCITARMVDQAGFSAVYMTGAGTAATLGYPDYGLITMSEMVENAGRIATAVNIPLIADADTGYGNELNVIRTVREYEKRGVAALHIEDQGFPKKCGHLDNKEIIPIDDYLAKIRAAVSARRDPNFVIIARTDSRAVLGFDEAVRRANASLQAGADIAFIEAPQTLEEVASIPQRVHGPCLLNVVWRGKTPEVAMDDARTMGYKIAIFPGILFKSVIATCDAVLDEMKRTYRHPDMTEMTVREVFRRVGADEWDSYREKFRTSQKDAAE
ncbi:oxaloacetate decarboxylase [Microvirga arabica]|uniref:Oxaloacetate decarboxylase n=1 Tax=Microvirga arabica TaxID=1128671 RepID=A0ABV6YBK1_9HYPH